MGRIIIRSDMSASETPKKVRPASAAATRLPPPRHPLPPVSFPEELPVSARREEIAAALQANQVIIVSGETGSGKTTQLPKICLSLGRGERGLIGHTQPRRIAATATAKRIAQELGSAPGMHVGYKIRFNDVLSDGAWVKLMTDGILLAETQSDPLLRNYDTLIIDEAATRATNLGVPRAHLVPYTVDGSVLLEVFTHDGVGTMISSENLESLREATIEDVASILHLIEPLEADGTLVKRGRELIEREVDYFSVIEHDGVIFGCAALYPFPVEKMAEMACLTVSPDSQAQGDGERLLKHLETRARAAGFKKLFVLTTRAAHWFLKRGFVMASIDDLPKDRQNMYNWQRKSMVLIKKL